MIIRTLFSIATVLLVSANAFAQDQESLLQVTIENIPSEEGKMMIGLYENEEDWLNTLFMGQVGKIEKGTSTVSFTNVPPGEYAISVFHDKNDNDKMDMILGMIPKEDYGCSNGAKGSFGPPKWVDAKFEITETNKEIKITL